MLDLNCHPITDAKVFIWQANSAGKYPYSPLKEQFDNHNIDLKTGSTFQGSAISTTNNRGEFTFITVYPGNVENEYPNINLRIMHPRFGGLQTKFYMHNNKLLYKEIPENELDDDTELIADAMMVEFDGYNKPIDLIIRRKGDQNIDNEAESTQDLNIFKMHDGYQILRPNTKNTYNLTVTLPTNENNLNSY